MTLRNYIQISQRKGKNKGSWACGCFLLKVCITAHTLKNYPNFKSKFSFNNGRIFEIQNYFRTRENTSFDDLSELINILSNQDLAGLDKFNKLENPFCMHGFAR